VIWIEPGRSFEREAAERSVAAFVYLLIGTGKVTVEEAETYVRTVEDMNLETQRKFFSNSALLQFAHGQASRILVGLCDHDGPHEEAEFPGRDEWVGVIH
jgi:hypothetical protein